MANATRATAKKMVTKHCADLNAEAGVEYIEIWFDSTNDDERGRAEKAADAIQAELGCHMFGNGSAWFIAYRRPVKQHDDNLVGLADPMHY